MISARTKNIALCWSPVQILQIFLNNLITPFFMSFVLWIRVKSQSGMMHHAKKARTLINNYHNYIIVITIIIIIIVIVIITIIQYCVITFIIDKLCKSSNTAVCFQAWMAEWLINSACLWYSSSPSSLLNRDDASAWSLTWSCKCSAMQNSFSQTKHL